MWLYVTLSLSIAVWVVLGAYVFLEIRKTYERNGVFSNRLLALWFVIWAFFHLAVVVSALFALWRLPVDGRFAIVAGSALVVIGLLVLAAGMLEFRTLRRSCGQDTTELVTTGIYRWSRNPQFIGCFIYLLGISLAGRSVFSFLLTGAAAIVIYWYTVRLAEPYLGRLYPQAYRFYISDVQRWLGAPGQGFDDSPVDGSESKTGD